MDNKLSGFEGWLRRNHKRVIAVWIIVLLLSLPFSMDLFHTVSYNITGNKASNSSANASSFMNTQLLVITGNNMFSNESRQLFINVSKAFPSANLTSMYSVEYSILNATRYQILSSAEQILNALYAKYNMTPSTVSPSLNDSIIAQASAEIYAHLKNSSATTGLQINGSLLGMISGTIKGYSNSTATYIFNAYSFPNYPVSPRTSTMDFFVNGNRNTSIAILNGVNYTQAKSVINGLSVGHGYTIYITGSEALTGNLANGTLGATFIAILIGIFAAIIITGIIFRSPIASIIPIFIFGVDLTISYSLFYLIFHYILNSTISFFDPAITSILMLGLATDYLTYILYRYRQERNIGKRQKESASYATKWAGEAVMVSGLTVISAYVVLSLFNLAFIGGSGVLNAVGISVVLLSALTLLPSLMYVFGDKLIYPNRKYKFGTGNIFKRFAEFDEKNARKNIAVFVAIVLVCAYVFITFGPDLNFLGLLPNSPAKSAFYVASNNFGYDPIDPLAINVSGAAGVTNISSITANLGKLPGVHSTSYSTSLNSAVITMYLDNMAFTKSALNTYNSINMYMKGTGANYTISGTQSFLGKTFNAIDGDIFPLIAILGVVIFMILFLLLFSVYTPIRLVLLLVSILMISNAITVIVFSLILSLPFIVIAQVFLITNIMGVGVDYDIFLVMRIKERVKMGEKNGEAVRNGLIHSGPIILSIGVILSTVFLSLLGSGFPILGEVGFIVGISILLDTFLSILVIVPSLMYLLSKYNWWPADGKR